MKGVTEAQLEANRANALLSTGPGSEEGRQRSSLDAMKQALGDPGATSGNGAQSWGLWSQQPGPSGCKLDRYDQLKAAGGVGAGELRANGALSATSGAYRSHEINTSLARGELSDRPTITAIRCVQSEPNGSTP
jgi:hypothetical protein